MSAHLSSRIGIGMRFMRRRDKTEWMVRQVWRADREAYLERVYGMADGPHERLRVAFRDLSRRYVQL